MDVELRPNRRKMRWGFWGGLVAAALGLASLFVLSRAERRRGLFDGRPIAQRAGVVVSEFTSQQYPTRSGAPLLLLRGRLENRSHSERDSLGVSIMLRTGHGERVVDTTALVGTPPTPGQLDAVTAPAARTALYAQYTGLVTLPPGGSTPFFALLLAVPEAVQTMQHWARIEHVPQVSCAQQPVAGGVGETGQRPSHAVGLDVP